MAFDDKTDRTDVPAVPLYQQVMDDLKGEIARGVYPAGSRIPAEMELAKSYGVAHHRAPCHRGAVARGVSQPPAGEGHVCVRPQAQAQDSPEG